MAHKTYFSRITADHWCAKNKLEEAAHKLAQEMDRKILEEFEVLPFKKKFQAKIDALNQEYHRCKPLRFSIGACHSNNGDISVWCDGVFSISLFLVKDKN
jgi:hypothetical protein